MEKKLVLVIGNSSDENDSLAIQLMPQLQETFPEVTFMPWDPTEELPKETAEKIILVDIVKGINSPKMFDGLDSFLISPRNTVHDFDLPVALKMLQKIGKVKTVRIIALPVQGSIAGIHKRVCSLLKQELKK